ncbi:GntR family transcriptional regulator [Streptomyces sp. SCSIO ZS0520]|uniref:GntR family transcriptional regulator n=1 Tax=Streptomyces sp. SCSIO ZS0520 TaxID=2892996 RepID=UPI0021D7DA5A|nr:GntR family transcriptional regulator [Streptomyces sp. SCSIO ZS0520]
MYMQLAQELAKAIKEGRYEPGDRLPSEAEMKAEYGVSQVTVRSALDELRGMGLIVKRHGLGSIVQGAREASTIVDRSAQRSGKVWRFPTLPERDGPSVSRMVLGGLPGSLLGQADQDAISVDRLLYDPQTGTRMAHRLIIPMATAAEFPALAEEPQAPLEVIFRHLSAKGPVEITDHIGARIPLPDERTALGLTDSSPLLITYRIAADATGRPLVCEEHALPAAGSVLKYPVRPTRLAKSREGDPA